MFRNVKIFLTYEPVAVWSANGRISSAKFEEYAITFAKTSNFSDYFVKVCAVTGFVKVAYYQRLRYHE